METIYLGKWGNYDKGDAKREEQLEQVLKAVDEQGEVKIAFDYIGFSKEEMVGHMMLNEAEKRGYTGTVGYRRALVLRKAENA